MFTLASKVGQLSTAKWARAGQPSTGRCLPAFTQDRASELHAFIRGGYFLVINNDR